MIYVFPKKFAFSHTNLINFYIYNTGPNTGPNTDSNTDSNTDLNTDFNTDLNTDFNTDPKIKNTSYGVFYI